ncbi:MAG: extracellular solute-binding protein [Chloroflexi bacterium]|nr:extracellular solute-binding protein [Chloroflexota bacterium]
MKDQLIFMVLVITALGVSCTPATLPVTPAASAGQQPVSSNQPPGDEWGRILTAAKAEGGVTIYGSTSPETRQTVSEAFHSKFGIRIDWVTGRGNETVQKILSEQRANINLADVVTGATMSTMNGLKPAGVLKPLEPALMLPEAKGTANWFQGKLWWVDDERTHLAYSLQALPAIVINTDLVKKDEIQSFRDLLNPKWKGKIIMDDPTIGGSGNGWVTAVGHRIMDINYLRELAKQEPVLLRNFRQEVEWLARGKYSVGLAMNAPEMSDLIRAGVSNMDVVIPREGSYLSQSRGAVSLLNKPAHPNAAIVYLNWILTREGQTVVSKAEGLQSARTDVPTDFVEPWLLRQPGAKYHDTISYEYNLKKDEYVEIAKKIFVNK